VSRVRIQFIGGGKMAEALVGGLIAADWARPEEIAVVERYESRRDELAERFPDIHLLTGPRANTATLIAVKPQDIDAALASLSGLGPRRVLSIAAGTTIATLERALDDGTAVVRSMPNTPALVGEAASAIAPGRHASDDDLAWGRSILESVGVVVTVDEADLDAVTGLSGSGPAYVFAFAEALAVAGERAGLDPGVAVLLANQTIVGSAKLLADSDDDAAQLRRNVTSPGGTTAEGLAVLEAEGFAELVADAVAAATKRSRDLGSA